jgi:DNA polymerase-3 subunit delta'
VTWGIVGQDRAVAALERALTEGRVAHAYLFVGPERVGKHTLALRLAQALNCDSEEPPCGECTPCRRIAGGLHADVQTVAVGEPEPDDESGPAPRGIHVSQVREVERATALKPYEGRSRVVIFDPAEEMNAAAQNAFLKTLEEPPPQVVFVLVTADESRLLPTVRSRCRRLELRLPSLDEIEGALAERGVDGERPRLLARLSRGRIGWALEAAADGSVLEKREAAIEQARSLATMRVADRMALAERLGLAYRRDPAPVLSALEAWRDWWRDVLLVQAGAEDGVASVDRLADLREDAAGRDREAVARFVRAAGDSIRYLGWNAQPRLVLEALLLEAPARATAGVA